MAGDDLKTCATCGGTLIPEARGACLTCANESLKNVDLFCVRCKSRLSDPHLHYPQCLNCLFMDMLEPDVYERLTGERSDRQ